MITYTKHTLKKIEDLLGDVGYIIRYEKGNFQSGYCIVRDRKIAIINKFYETEARINCLLDIISDVDINSETLSEKSAKIYQKIEKTQKEELDEN